MSINPRPKWGSFVVHPERIVAVALILAAGYLHVLVLTHAGALWRDEVGTLGLATLPEFAETWRMLIHNADPILFPVLVRTWAAVGLGSVDFGFRMLGFIIGLSLLAAIWFSARLMRLGWPVLSLALVAINPALVRWGDSLRPYGLGSALLLLVVGSVWSFVNGPSRNRYLMASILGLLSVQTLYQSAFFLLAICCAGALVYLRKGRPREAMATLCIGLPAALSVVAYAAPLIEARRWLAAQSAGFHPFPMWIGFFEVLDSSVEGLHWVWLALLLLAVGLGFATLATGSQTTSDDQRDRSFFATLNLIIGTVVLLVYHGITKFQPYPWHWLPAMAFAAVNLEAAIAGWAKSIQTLWLVFICFVSIASLPGTIRGAKYGHTNMAVIAAQTLRDAKPGDLICVYPWYLGITFARYYTGSAEWVTLPEVNDLRFHRYDLIEQDMLADKPIKPVLDRIQLALASGHRVWLVGGLPGWKTTDTGAPNPSPVEPQKSNNRWLAADYAYSRGAEVADFLSKHAQHSWSVGTPLDQGLIGFESARVFVVAGWKSTNS
jgi:hypothetical protein